jgi:hypothetical protein
MCCYLFFIIISSHRDCVQNFRTVFFFKKAQRADIIIAKYSQKILNPDRGDIIIAKYSQKTKNPDRADIIIAKYSQKILNPDRGDIISTYYPFDFKNHVTLCRA